MTTHSRNIRIEDELWAAAKKRAAGIGTTVSEVIVQDLGCFVREDWREGLDPAAGQVAEAAADRPLPDFGPYEVHPFAARFPLLEGEEFNALMENIRDDGLQEPIVLTCDGKRLIDGRNRYQACLAATRDMRFEKLGDSYTEADLISYIVSANLTRRHLTPSRAAALAADAQEALEAVRRGPEPPAADPAAPPEPAETAGPYAMLRGLKLDLD